MHGVVYVLVCVIMLCVQFLCIWWFIEWCRCRCWCRRCACIYVGVGVGVGDYVWLCVFVILCVMLVFFVVIEKLAGLLDGGADGESVGLLDGVFDVYGELV